LGVISVPFRFEFDEDRRVLCAIFTGKFSVADFQSAGTEIRWHISNRNPVAEIWDYSEVTSFDISSNEIRQMANAPPTHPPGLPEFIVAPSDYLYGMMRMFQVLSETIRHGLRVIRTREEAYGILRTDITARKT
jgi:hypothetical protein